MLYEVITDSSANLTEELISKYKMHIIPFHCFIDNHEYLCYEEGKEFDGHAFYDKMRNGADVRTSLISPGNYTEYFESFLKDGKDILYIAMSGGLSGTFESSKLAAEDLRDKYPDRKIEVVDSMGASLGQGLVVCNACRMSEENVPMDETIKWIEKNRLSIIHIFTVGNLKYLVKGGRLSNASAILGNLFNIKPILKASNQGTIIFTEKVRGRKQALNRLADEIKEKYKDIKDQFVSIAHCDCEEDAQYLADRIKSLLGIDDIIITCYEPCTGTHVGPGTVALFFMGTER